MADTTETKLVQFITFEDLANRINDRLNNLENGGTAIKAAAVDGNQLKFFDTTDTSATAAFSIDLPAEKFIDMSSTGLIPSFTFSSDTYLGATNPNFDDKPVMVFGVTTKSNDGASETTNYSFMDFSPLVDTYTASDTSLIFSNTKVSVNISAAENNALKLESDGLHVGIASDKDVNTILSSYFILASDPQLSLNSDTLTVKVGNSENITATWLGDGEISVSATTLLEGITYDVSDTQITFINASATSGTGIYSINLSATSTYDSATATVNVTGAPAE